MKNEQATATIFQTANHKQTRDSEQGFALVAALIILILLGVISATVLTFASAETRQATSDLNRVQTFYAAESKLEDMSFQFNNLFQSTATPDASALADIANNNSPAMTAGFASEGYDFTGSTLGEDAEAIAGFTRIFGAAQPFLRIPNGPYFGMSASVKPYIGVARATHTATGTKVRVIRRFNSYLIPIFQFSIFSNTDVELEPGVLMSVSGRVHANGNIYAMRNLLFTGNITTAGELVRDVTRLGDPNSKPGNKTVEMAIPAPASSCPGTPRICRVPMNFRPAGAFIGSVVGGPNFPAATEGERGFWPGSPDGIANSGWDTDSLSAPVNNNDPGHFDKRLLTRSSTGFEIKRLDLPLGVENVTPVELIKRSVNGVDGFSSSLSEARYMNKAKVRILIDDEPPPLPPTNTSGIQAGGVLLSDFEPLPLCNTITNCNPLRRVSDIGGSPDAASPDGAYPRRIPLQRDSGGALEPTPAATVRGVQSNSVTRVIGAENKVIPGGAGLKGRIKIEIAPLCTAPCTPTYIDVTSTILSMGMTVGEPNAIVRLQRPLWAAFMQDSRDRTGELNPATLYNMQIENLTSNGWEADGEIKRLTTTDFDNLVVPGSGLGFIRTPLTAAPSGAGGLNEDLIGGSNQPIREYKPAFLPDQEDPANPAPPNVLPNPLSNLGTPTGVDFNAIVPINFYNVREGWINNSQNPFLVSKRGVTSVIDINMYNLRRWLDGVYDSNLLSGTSAVSTNIGSDRGYVVYISDRRGDEVRSEVINPDLTTGTTSTTDGNVDNEDVYFDPTTSVPVPDSLLVYPVMGAASPEDVITNSVFMNKTDSMQKRPIELPDTLITTRAEWDAAIPTSFEDRLLRSINMMSWHNDGSLQQLEDYVPENYFRRSVRLSFGETLATNCTSSGTTPVVWLCGTGKLSGTKGITVATENMLYLAGNYNTNGLGSFVSGGPNLNTGNDADYRGVQVPAGIICDAFFPLSRTWFDANSSMYPEGNDGGNASFGSLYYRVADNTTNPAQETAVRAAIMFGTTNSALRTGGGGSPARNAAGLISSGGMHNAPRFLEQWNNGTQYTWSFSGSMVTLFNSTQAFAPWENQRAVTYIPPTRNWSYDGTFTDPNRLPPGTPYFQYIQASGFEQEIEK